MSLNMNSNHLNWNYYLHNTFKILKPEDFFYRNITKYTELFNYKIYKIYKVYKMYNL